MRAERVRQLSSQAQTTSKRLQDARGAFAARPAQRPGSSSASSALKRQARALVASRNEGETVLADFADAQQEVQTDLQRAQQDSAEAQQAVATAEQDEGAGGLGAVGARSSAGNNARARAQTAQNAQEQAQQQATELREGSAPLEEEVQAASDTGTLLAGFEGDERDKAATALEDAQKSEGPPRRKASKAKILAGGLLGGGLGAGIGGLIGGGIGAVAGLFLGSAGLGAAVGAGAGALLGGLFGSVAGGVVASRKGRTAVPTRAGANPHDEGTYDDIDGATDVALAPERLRALNAAAPAPVSRGANGSLLDESEPAQGEQRNLGARLTARSTTGRHSPTPDFRGSLPGIAETDDELYDAMERVRVTGSSPKRRSGSPAPSLPTLGQDDEGEAAAQAQDARDRQAALEEQQRQTALQAQRRLESMHDEEGAVAGSGAISARASLTTAADSTPQMSAEERAIFEQGLAFKESGQDADAVSGVPATAQAMFGTDKLNAVQAHSLKKKQLEAGGQSEVARTLAGPPSLYGTAAKAGKKQRTRKAKVREISDEDLDAAASPASVGSAPTESLEPAVATQAVIGGFESLSPENQAYYARLLSSDSGISPGQAMSMAQRRQAATGTQGTATQEPAAASPKPNVATYETGKAAPGFFARAYSSVRGTVGDALLSAGVVDEFDGWSAPMRDETPRSKPTTTEADSSASTSPTTGVPEESPAAAPQPQMESILDKLDTSEAGKAKYTAQYNRTLHPEPTLDDWVSQDDTAMRGNPTATAASPAAPTGSAGLLGSVMGFFRGSQNASPAPTVSPAPSSGYESGTASPVTTPVPSPSPTPVPAPADDITPAPVDPRSAAYSNMTGEEAAALGRQRGIAMGEARRQAAIESQARTKSRIQNEQTWYGSAWEYLSSGLMTKEERDEERKQTRKQHRDEAANRWLS
jgi:hypothetical protein